MRRLLRPEAAFFLAVMLLLLLAFRERGFYDPGALWHVKVGELIVDHGFPTTDPFTYTFEGRTWIPQQWGAEVLMAVAHRAGGLDAMLLGFAVLVATLYTLIFRRALQAGMGPMLAGLLVGAALVVGAFHYFVRPHMATIALLGWTMMCVVDFERGRCSTWRLAGLIPLFVLWTNLHGGVLGGTMTLGLAVAGWGVLFLARRESPITNWRTAWLLVAVVAACGLTPFVNPFGMEMLNTWRRIVGSKVLPEVVNEHMPLDPASPLGLTVIGFGVLYLALLAGTLPKLPRVSWLIPIAWLVLSFKGIRQGPLFAITAAVALADLWPHTVWHRLLVKYGDGSLAHAPERRPGWAWAAIPAAVVMLIATLQLTGVEAPVVGRGWARLDPDFIPVELADEMRAYAAAVPPGTPVFNDANLGGFLIYHTPTLKIFMDDRCELYGDDWIRAYSDTLGLPPAELGPVFEGWAGRYGFRRAIVMTDPTGTEKPPIERYLLGAGGWREVARAKRAVVFDRVN
ncbi:hypothetical protein [Urbifossiella limnaea]|uniref:Glycosyltransferase RgtA/B/C/D-like domain-containing protein n=1 Tax=Urbifossiella limnaea TaxID=2528023 RepID=A0A517Y132_9BACT|nr:hypothetical protein [Urbifossiella limnaea]QDU23428.1 hypothetical protein ETAA1_54280 [Urbifossiella limnaea]